MGKKLDYPNSLQQVRQFGMFDDFMEGYTTAQRGWTSSLTGSGTIAVTTGAGGILAISTVDSTTNREDYIISTASPFLFAADKPLVAEAFIDFTEASTNQNNTIFGFMNSVAAGALVNGNGGISTNFWGACFFKVGGTTTKWKVCTSFGTTQSTDTTTIDSQVSNYTRLRIEIYPVSSTVLEAAYWIDTGKGLLIAKNNTVSQGMNVPIKHTGVYTGASAMQLFAGVKNGTTAAEALNVDYIGGWQLRQTADGL